MTEVHLICQLLKRAGPREDQWEAQWEAQWVPQVALHHQDEGDLHLPAQVVDLLARVE